jgi:hypothetical protein
MAKTEFLQIRLAPQDRDRVFQVAYANHLEPSTWARQAILRALDEWEASRPPSKEAGKDDNRSAGE